MESDSEFGPGKGCAHELSSQSKRLEDVEIVRTPCVLEHLYEDADLSVPQTGTE